MAKKEIKEIIICGKNEGVIRKAYFEKKLPQLLNEIQGNNVYNEGDVEKLGLYLEKLKAEDKKFVETVAEVFEGKIMDNDIPPSVDELREGASDEEWRDKADKAMAYIENTLDTVRNNIAGKKTFSSNFWGDTALVFISMQSVLEKDLIFKRQLYKAKLTKIIDDFGVSRKEAEERAELTKEFFNYKCIDKLNKRLEEFYTFARRRDDATNHR